MHAQNDNVWYGQVATAHAIIRGEKVYAMVTATPVHMPNPLCITMSDALLQSVFSTAEMTAATSDAAWLQAMLDFEAALAQAQADVGLVPHDAAQVISAQCRADNFDIDALGRETSMGGNPAIPVVSALTRLLPNHVRGHVHRGATSQDVIDTAIMRMLQRALPLIINDLEAVETACAGLAETHCDTLMAGRTLLQQGPPITFGLKAAGWLASVRRARRDLQIRYKQDLALQFGGAVGTLAPLGNDGGAVLAALARRLDLAEPELPWHSAPDRLLRIGSTLAIVASALGKIAEDVALLMQTEIGEVSDPNAGGSSSMPHKRNPVAATLTLAAARRVHGLVGELFSASIHEHERAIGSWHAQWQPLFDCLRLTAAAAHHMRSLTAGLIVNTDRMHANLWLTRGVTLAEAAKSLLAPQLGRETAHQLVAEACNTALTDERPLADVLAENITVTAQFDAKTLRQVLQPHNYTGSAKHFIDRVLADRAP